MVWAAVAILMPAFCTLLMIRCGWWRALMPSSPLPTTLHHQHVFTPITSFACQTCEAWKSDYQSMFYWEDQSQRVPGTEKERVSVVQGDFPSKFTPLVVPQRDLELEFLTPMSEITSDLSSSRSLPHQESRELRLTLRIGNYSRSNSSQGIRLLGPFPAPSAGRLCINSVDHFCLESLKWTPSMCNKFFASYFNESFWRAHGVKMSPPILKQENW